MEAYGVEHGGDFSGLDGYRAELDSGATLSPYGWTWQSFYAPTGHLRIEANASGYCIVGRHRLLTGGRSGWRRASYESGIGEPRPFPDVCPNL